MKVLNLKKFEIYSKFLKIKTKDRRLIPFSPDSWFGSQKYFHSEWIRRKAEGRLQWFLILKYRQGGVSTYSEARIFHNTVTHRNTNSLILADKKPKAAYIFDMCHTFWQMLPPELQPEKRSSTQSRLIFDTGDRDTNPGLRSAIYIDTALDPEAGQSMTLHNVHCTEAASYPYLGELFTNLIPSIPKTPDAIAIIESTAKGAGEEFHQEWLQARAGKSIFNAVFIGWYMSEYRLQEGTQLYDEYAPHGKYTKYEKNIIRIAYKEYKVEISDEQIAWRRWSIDQEFRGDEDSFNQEYPGYDEEAFIVAGNVEFDRKRLKDIQANVVKPLHQCEIVIDHIGDYDIRGHLEARDGGQLWIWREPEANHIYRVSIDPAGGIDTISKDYIAMQVIDVGLREQVAEYQIRTDQIRAAHIGVILARYYNEAKLVIELNYGFGTQNEAKRYYYNFYHHQHLDRMTNKITDRIGFWSTWQYKKETIGYAHFAINEGLYKINSSRLSSELNTFVSQGGEQLAAAAPGCHDDLVMAWIIGVYTAYQEREEVDYAAKDTSGEMEIFRTLQAAGVHINDADKYKEDEEVKEEEEWMEL